MCGPPGLTSVDSLPAPVPAPRSLTAPAISGDPVAGQVIACGAGGWDAESYPYTYAWFRGDGTPLNTGAGHTVAAGDTTLYCTVTAAGLTTATVGDGHGEAARGRDAREPHAARADGPDAALRHAPVRHRDLERLVRLHLPLAARRRADRRRDAGELHDRLRRLRALAALRGLGRHRLRAQPGRDDLAAGRARPARDQRRPARPRDRPAARRAAGTATTPTSSSGSATASPRRPARPSTACSAPATSATSSRARSRPTGPG